MGLIRELIQFLIGSENNENQDHYRKPDELVSFEELFETYRGGFVFEYEEFKRDLQKKFGAVASNIFISTDDYEHVVEGLMDCYSYVDFAKWLESRIKSMDIDLSNEKIKVVKNEKGRLIVVKV